MAEIKKACFDVDGHLGHTIPKIKDYHWQHYVLLYGVSPPDEHMELVDKLISHSSEEVFRGLHAERLAVLSKKARAKEEAYLDKGFHDIAEADLLPAVPIAGVPQEIARLHSAGVDLFLVTNRGSKTVKKALRAAGIDPDLFEDDHIYAGERNKELGGKAGSLREIKRAHSLSREQMSMSGDDIKDVQAGLAAGVLAFGVPRPGLDDAERATFRHGVESAGGVYYPTFEALGQTAILPLHAG